MFDNVSEGLDEQAKNFTFSDFGSTGESTVPLRLYFLVFISSAHNMIVHSGLVISLMVFISFVVMLISSFLFELKLSIPYNSVGLQMNF